MVSRRWPEAQWEPACTVSLKLGAAGQHIAELSALQGGWANESSPFGFWGPSPPPGNKLSALSGCW